MEQFLPGLYHDLDRTCHVIKGRLDSGDLPGEVTSQASRAYAMVERIHREVRERVTSGELVEPSLGGLHLRMLRHLIVQLQGLDGSILPAIERFDSPDRLATRLCARLAAQTRWPVEPPLVTTMSANYYWVHPQVNLLFIPTTEDASRLGLPDMCHEMAHILLEAHRQTLLGDFFVRVSEYTEGLDQQVKDGKISDDHRIGIKVLDESWTKLWYQEFVPDIVATFTIGPPYGWQHVRLSSRTCANPCHPSFGQTRSHPADDARLTCIAATLKALGGTNEADELLAVWGGYMEATRARPDAGYGLAYPANLMQRLVDNVLAGCTKLGIRSYHRPQRYVRGDVVQLMRDLWRAFRADPKQHFRRDRGRFHQRFREIR
jgi:hypothetical protein